MVIVASDDLARRGDPDGRHEVGAGVEDTAEGEFGGKNDQ